MVPHAANFTIHRPPYDYYAITKANATSCSAFLGGRGWSEIGKLSTAAKSLKVSMLAENSINRFLNENLLDWWPNAFKIGWMQICQYLSPVYVGIVFRFRWVRLERSQDRLNRGLWSVFFPLGHFFSDIVSDSVQPSSPALILV